MDTVQSALKKKFPHVHPLLFKRCVEKTKTNGELFDMLSSIPNEYPIVWDEESRSWIITNDLVQNPDKEENDE